VEAYLHQVAILPVEVHMSRLVNIIVRAVFGITVLIVHEMAVVKRGRRAHNIYYL
jgi:hypothetical protein